MWLVELVRDHVHGKKILLGRREIWKAQTLSTIWHISHISLKCDMNFLQACYPKVYFILAANLNSAEIVRLSMDCNRL